MATQGDYTAGANALMHLIYAWLPQVPTWEQAFIPKDKIPAASGAGAKAVIDAVDAYRAQQAPAAMIAPKRKYRRHK